MKLPRLVGIFGQFLPSKPVSTSSLQFRLTLELLTISIIGLGSVAIWAGWQMEQNLVAAHKQTLEYIAKRFPEQLEMYAQMGSLTTGLEKTIERVSTAGLVIWVKNSAIKGQLSGKLYLSQDITADHQKYQAGLWGLFWLSILVLLSLIVLISQRIRQAMLPLTRMSQIASAVSADDLSGAKLQLEQAPDEILGLATAFNQMLWRLSGAWEQQRQFVGNVSHELRTPLTVVIGYLQSLQRRSTNLNPYQQQALETATSETERIIRMLQDLLDLARADSGHLHFRSHPIILNTLLTEVAAMSQKVSDRKMTLLLTNEDVVICGDQDRLQQVLINLLDNAIKYSAPGQTVDLILEKQPSSALIHVRDRGIGISLSHQNRIFERFYRVDESMTRSRDGTGLGLAIAKSLIEGMEGRITLRSQPGQGSTFTIILPLWQPQL